MSDSDSDFAYESAGEDAELGTDSADDRKSVLKGKSIEKVESGEPKEPQSIRTNPECVKDKLEEVTKEAESLTLSDKDIVGNGKDDQCLESGSQSKVSFSETYHGNESSSKNTDLVNQETEPKRVKLRLEKKLMEKSQSASNKTSPDASLCSPSSSVPVPAEKPSSWGWGSWGSSLLSTAATSVTTFTSQVSQGIGTVIETVETTLGAPPPEELAASLSNTEKETSSPTDKGSEEVSPLNADATVETTDAQIKETPTEEKTGDSKTPATSLFSGVTSLTKVLESTGTKVIMGGLDTLELIGKKTIDILTEGDPGLRKKRAALSEGMTLSQILRDAQIRAEERKSSESDDIQETVLYTKYFDEFQGLVHLEALEMLSKQCESKVQSVLNTISNDAAKKHILDEIKDICEDLPSSDDMSDEENQDFARLFSEHMEALHLPLNSTKLVQVQVTASEVICGYEETQDKADVQVSKEIHSQAISCLADFTAKCVEHFHKLGELILVQQEWKISIIDCTTHLTELTQVLSIETGSLAAKFCNCLNAVADASEDHDSVTPLITSVYLEASNSTTYIQDAFQLLIPVLQLAVLQ